MRVQTATTPLPTKTALGRNLTPSTSTTTLCAGKNMGPKTREMVDRLVPLQHTGKAGCSPLGATNRDGNPTNRPTLIITSPSKPNNLAPPPRQTVQRTAAVVSSFRPHLLSAPNRCVSRLYPHIVSFYVRKSPPAIGPGVEH